MEAVGHVCGAVFWLPPFLQWNMALHLGYAKMQKRNLRRDEGLVKHGRAVITQQFKYMDS